MKAKRGAAFRKNLRSPRFFLAILLGSLAAVLAFSQAAASIGLPIDTFRPLGAGFFSTRQVQVEMARRVVGDGPPAQPARVAAVGRNGLYYAPLNTRALWLVGQSLEAQGKVEGARNAMRQADRVSRRDAAVQLWLGLDNLKRNEIKAGLRHFDLLIRTNNEGADLVTPALAKVIAQPDGRREMTPYFNESNPWVLNLTAAAVQNPKAAPLAQLLVDRKEMAPDVDGIHPVYAAMVQKLVAEGSYGLALRVYPKLPGADAVGLRSANPGSGKGIYEGYAPFTWGFSGSDAQRGDFIGLGEGRIGLEVAGSPGTVGIAASKLVVPSANGYFRWRVVERTQNPESSARWLLTCLRGKASKPDARSADLLADDMPLNRAAFLPIPSGCPLLKIDLQISGGVGRSPAEVIVDQLELVESR